jgi:hypothetical protein
MVSDPFPQLTVTRKTGGERFRDGHQPLPFDLLSFWQWSASDLASNALRGRVAEFLVAQALDIANGVRAEWDAYDLRARCGATIEVKSAAYLQTWAQKSLSAISFNIAPTRSWDAATNVLAPEARRQADLYVFALLAHQDKATFDPMDVEQWVFFVLPTTVLNTRFPAQKQLGLAGLRNLGPVECRFGQLRATVEVVAQAVAGGTPGTGVFGSA